MVTDCCYGPKEIVEHGESGWIVPRDDVAAFGKAMDTILTHPELAARFSAGGKRRALQFDVDKMVLEYTTLFIEQAVTRRAAMAPRIGALQSAWS
ncbi:MAG: glycosyltransferase [Caulobacteraceae bacterium]